MPCGATDEGNDFHQLLTFSDTFEPLSGMNMKQDKKPPPSPHTRRRKESKTPYILAVILVAAFSVFFYFWVKGDLLPGRFPFFTTKGVESTTNGTESQENTITGEQNNLPAGKGPDDQSTSQTAGQDNKKSATPLVGSQSQQAQGNDIADNAQSGTIAAASDTADTAQQVDGNSSPRALVAQLNGFYKHLDKQQYMQQFNLPEPSKVYFSKLIQKLLDNPPVVNRETDDLFTLLKNTAHFFRILGKDNIMVLKGILDREKKSFETILQSFYELTDNPEILKREYGIIIPDGALHDYAAFFLNTMGGRLYLFRRDSLSRLAVSYYSILVVDKAITDGNGRHGIDLHPAIDSLIDELENGGDRLQLKDIYLNKLYDLQQKYTR